MMISAQRSLLQHSPISAENAISAPGSVWSYCDWICLHAMIIWPNYSNMIISAQPISAPKSTYLVSTRSSPLRGTLILDLFTLDNLELGRIFSQQCLIYLRSMKKLSPLHMDLSREISAPLRYRTTKLRKIWVLTVSFREPHTPEFFSGRPKLQFLSRHDAGFLQATSSQQNQFRNKTKTGLTSPKTLNKMASLSIISGLFAAWSLWLAS